MHALREALKSEDHERSTYTILFSYVLDDLVWDELEEARIVMERKITGEKPFWAGFLWAVYPTRKFSSGTNSSTDQGVGLYLHWSKTGAKLIFSVYSDFEAYTALFEDIKKFGKVKNAKVMEVFRPYNIFDSNGYLTIPVIIEDDHNKLYKLSKEISKQAGKEVSLSFDIQELMKKLSIPGIGETMVVIYHELMWDLLDYFESQGIIQKPIVFTSPEKAGLRDISDLMFIVKQRLFPRFKK